MKINIMVVAAALVSASMLHGEEAYAASDVKSFSSMVCIPNGAASATGITYSYQGVFNTSSTNNVVVICPLLKDSDDTITDANPADLNFTWRTAGALPGVVNCAVHVGSLTSGSFSASSSNTEVAAATTRTTTLPVRTSPTWWNEPINLVCSMSPRTRLTRIYLTEYGSTNTP